jgi:hypothetical protein
MTDNTMGQRQARQQAYTPDPGRDLFSDEAHVYVDAVPGLQAAAAANPELNGDAARGRVRGANSD